MEPAVCYLEGPDTLLPPQTDPSMSTPGSRQATSRCDVSPSHPGGTVDRPLVDSFGRRHTSLRISITDRCNIRCVYCMPATDVEFLPRAELLSFEEITRLAKLLVGRSGFDDIRLTGGEPLVRRDCDRLVAMLAVIPGLRDLSMTTNGLLLAENDWAKRLRTAGLKRLNVSIDSVDEAVFQKITRRQGADRVIAGVDAAISAGFDTIKLNALAIRGISETELSGLAKLAAHRGVALRLIEYMPLDADRAWQQNKVLTGQECLKILESQFGPVEAIERDHESSPAESFRITIDGRPLSLGIIRSVSRPFCQQCNRLRLTADGAIRNCLFARTETPIRDALRGGASDDELLDKIESAVSDKRASHGMDSSDFQPPDRAMYAIGG